jgi:potassium voltage-gated channel Shal-related subfamily D member 2
MSSSSIPLRTVRYPRTEDEHHTHLPPNDIEDIFPDRAGLFRRSSEAGGEPIPLASGAPEWKRELYALLEHPTSSSAAFALYVFTTGLIVVSALITVFETVPAFHEISPGVWFGLETSMIALFTIEYVARCVAWSLSWRTLLQWVGCEYIIFLIW